MKERKALNVARAHARARQRKSCKRTDLEVPSSNKRDLEVPSSNKTTTDLEDLAPNKMNLEELVRTDLEKLVSDRSDSEELVLDSEEEEEVVSGRSRFDDLGDLLKSVEGYGQMQSELRNLARENNCHIENLCLSLCKHDSLTVDCEAGIEGVSYLEANYGWKGKVIIDRK